MDQREKAKLLVEKCDALTLEIVEFVTYGNPGEAMRKRRGSAAAHVIAASLDIQASVPAPTTGEKA